MDADEKRLKQEDCNEDELGTGVLTLTNKRIAFDKRKSRIADFSTKMGETVIDVPLDQVDVWKEGRFIKKICFVFWLLYLIHYLLRFTVNLYFFW